MAYSRADQFAARCQLANQPALRTAAQRVFDEKLPLVRKIVKFRADTNGLPPDDAEDIAQEAALLLWRQSLKHADPESGGFDIHCGLIATAAYTTFKRRQLRHRVTSLDLGWEEGRHGGPASSGRGTDRPGTLGERLPTHRGTIRVDGVVLNVTDMDIDVGPVVSALEARKLLGVSRQALDYRLAELDGIRISGRYRYGRWGFPLRSVLAHRDSARPKRRRGKRQPVIQP